MQLFLLLLLGADGLYIAVHLVHALTTWLPDQVYSLQYSGGMAEFSEYIKWWWIILMLGCLAWQSRSALLGAWTLLFTYAMCDDAMEIHETVGLKLARRWGFPDAFHLRSQDFGELLVAGVAGAALLSLIVICYPRASREARHITQDLLFLLAGVGFFGIVVDMIDIMPGPGAMMEFLSAVEDGGEMLAVSALCAYVFALFLCRGRLPVPYWRQVALVLRKKVLAPRQA